MSERDITLWINRLAGQPNTSMEVIWQNYYDKLITVARRKLSAMPRRQSDEEDVVTDALHSLYQGVQNGKFPDLNDRHDLWKLLLTITARKAGKAIRHNLAEKRGAGQVRGESVFANVNDKNIGIDEVLGPEPSPEFAEQIVNNCEELLGRLDDHTLNQIAVLKLEGFTNEEIAERTGCALRSVERKLKRIRAIWEPT